MVEKTPIDELADDLAVVLLAEWIAIDHDETRLQADKYMDEAQSLADWLQAIGWSHLNTKALIENGRQLERDEVKLPANDYEHLIKKGFNPKACEVCMEIDKIFQTLKGGKDV